jgi:hypothetical protein
MDDDPYALCYDIEKDAAKAFDKTGLAAFERQIRTRFEAAATVKPAQGKALGHEPQGVRGVIDDVRAQVAWEKSRDR